MKCLFDSSVATGQGFKKRGKILNSYLLQMVFGVMLAFWRLLVYMVWEQLYLGTGKVDCLYHLHLKTKYFWNMVV